MTIPPLAEATLWFALILGMTALFFIAVRKWSGKSGDDPLMASDMLTKFRELHASGGLSDTEYRTIKTKLAPELAPDTPGAIESARPTDATERTADGLSGLPVFRLLTESDGETSEES